MIIEKQFPLLYGVLKKWTVEPERPPLLLNGTDAPSWEWLKNDIVKIFTSIPLTLEKEHPDVLILEKDPKKQNIEVKLVREFISKLSISSFELPFKIGFIPEAHLLNVQSQNALLKTLEEPLKNRYLVLGTISKNKLLPTILSRSTIINFNRNPSEKEDIASQHEEVIKLYKDCLKSSQIERLQKGQEWSEGKTQNIQAFFNLIIPKLHSDMLEELRKNNFATVRKLSVQLKKALNYSGQLERTSGASPKLLFEAFLLSC